MLKSLLEKLIRQPSCVSWFFEETPSGPPRTNVSMSRATDSPGLRFLPGTLWKHRVTSYTKPLKPEMAVDAYSRLRRIYTAIPARTPLPAALLSLALSL